MKNELKSMSELSSLVARFEKEITLLGRFSDQIKRELSDQEQNVDIRQVSDVSFQEDDNKSSNLFSDSLKIEESNQESELLQDRLNEVNAEINKVNQEIDSKA